MFLTLLGVTFLNEAFSPIRGVGAVIVMTGVLMAQFATPTEARPIILEEP